MEKDLTIGRAFIDHARNFLAAEYLPRIAHCLDQLNEEEIWWRPNKDSNTIGNLLLHLSGNVRQWIVSGLGGAEDHRERQSEFDAQSGFSKEELLSGLKRSLADVDEVLAGFDPSCLLEAYEIQKYDVTALEAIFHVTEHFSMHTGQIILLTKLLTAKDLHFYEV